MGTEERDNGAAYRLGLLDPSAERFGEKKSTPAATRTRAPGSGGRCSIHLSYGGTQQFYTTEGLSRQVQPATAIP